MQFVCSVPLDNNTSVLGEVIIDLPTPFLLYKLSATWVDQLSISKFTLSDGIEIYQSININKENLFLYSQLNSNWNKTILWYLFLRFLSGNFIYCPELEYKIGIKMSENIQWVAEISSSSMELIFILQLKQDNIVKKLAQLIFSRQKKVELDLFKLSHQLFQFNVNSNNFINKVLNDLQNLQGEIQRLTNEKTDFDCILAKRDQKSRKIMVKLLNSKKKKIIELEKKLFDVNNSDILSQNDSNIINTNVINPISELNSPGKRRKKSVNKNKDVNTDESRSLEAVNLKFEDDFNSYMKREEEEEDFEPIEFMGINRKRKLASSLKNEDIIRSNTTNSSGNESGTSISSEQETDIETETETETEIQ